MKMIDLFKTTKYVSPNNINRLYTIYPIVGGCLIPLGSDIYISRRKENMDYQLKVIDVFKSERLKDVYMQCCKGVEEPMYTDYDWDYYEDDDVTRKYTFYDQDGNMRKEADILNDGTVSSVTLYDKFGNKTLDVSLNYCNDNSVRIDQLIYNGNNVETNSFMI